MHPLIEKIQDDVQSAWRFRWWALVVSVAIAIVGWGVVFALPDRFEAFARVFVDTRTALKPVLQNIAVGQDVNAQLNFVRQSLLAGEQLERIAEESGVIPPTMVDPSERSGILASLANRVELTVSSASDREEERSTAGSIYGVSYRDADRDRALRVVDTVLNTLVEETLGGKRADAESAQKFLESSIRDYEQRLRAAEGRLAEFKKQHIGLMPADDGQGSGYFAQLQSALDAIKKAETDLSIAVSRRAELSKQLRGETAITAATATHVSGSSGGAAGVDSVSRIKETQARLDDLLLRFTDRHPDVIATRATLEELKRRREQEIADLRRGDPAAVAASGASSNPVYQSIQLALNQVDVEIATLRGQIAQHNSKVQDLRQRLDTAPQVEAEFAQLNRDYDVNKSQYTALLASYEKARLGERADNAGSVRFEVVQPPTAAFRPVWPQRGMLLVAVLLGAIAAGAGVAFLLHLLQPVIGSSRGLAELTGLPVLGTVSEAFPEQLKADARRDAWRFALAASLLIVAFGVSMLLNRMGVKISLATGAS